MQAHYYLFIMNSKKLENKSSIVLRTILVFTFLIFTLNGLSQKRVPEKLFIDGIVSGYYHNTGNNVSKKDRQIKMEGVIGGVTIGVLQNDNTIFSTKTNKKGIFQLTLNIGSKYQIEFSKAGYTTSTLLIDLNNIPKEIASEGLVFENLEMLLNSYNSSNTINSILPFGRIFYNAESGLFNFEEINVKTKKGIFSKEKIENPAVSLIEQAILKNKNNHSSQQIADEKTAASETGVSNFPKQTLSSNFVFKNTKIEKFTLDEIKSRESELYLARKQFEKDKLNAKTAQDSIMLKQREAMLLAAENELVTAKKYIEIQDKIISSQEMFLILLLGFLLLLLVFIYVIYKNHKQRKATNILLEQKNKKITDSINYASRIQQSILLSDEEVKNIVPESFIFYQPRDIVSGDFYWLSEINEKVIIAAVDCTGHGVPGAFMSFIGHTLMNDIINERKIIQPSEILNKLHEGVVKLLRQDLGDMNSQDGMELSLCVYDKKSKILHYAGAMNPAYIIKNKEILILTPDERAIGGMDIYEKNNEKRYFTDKQIKISKNDILYLFSDGYADQFGGNENVKFNLSRFNDTLIEIHGKEMNEQKILLEKVINTWKGNYKQIDDMLVIGVKF